LKNGYKWVQYVSFEHEIESRKSEYYRALRACQAERPNEDITVWIQLFFSSLRNIQSQLMLKLKQCGMETQLSPREKSILTLIQSYPGIRSGEIAVKLAIPNPTVKRILAELKAKELIEQHGIGRQIAYSSK
jgi:Fic family protein